MNLVSVILKPQSEVLSAGHTLVHNFKFLKTVLHSGANLLVQTKDYC